MVSPVEGEPDVSEFLWYMDCEYKVPVHSSSTYSEHVITLLVPVLTVKELNEFDGSGSDS